MRFKSHWWLFLGLVVVLDLGIGQMLDRLYRRTFTGERGGLTNYALAKDTDVLVLGSSRAQYQVNSAVLGAKLGLRVYNAGLKGHDFLYSLMLDDLWKRRHGAPEVVVLTVDVESFVLRENELGSANLFGPYLGESDLVREVLYQTGPWRRVQYLSHAYRFNGKVFPILKNVLSHGQPASTDGYLVTVGVMDVNDPQLGAARHGMLDVPPGTKASPEASRAVASEAFWPPKVKYMRQMALDAAKDGTRLFVVHPPIYNLDQQAHDVWWKRVQELMPAEAHVELLDLCEYGEGGAFAADPTLYRDFAHMNGPGAEKFSQLLADKMAQRLSR
jgi:hypothetical protein